jgi:CRISPR-associated Csx14 family protein
MEHILIASLGESPVVITAMYDMLTKQENLPISKVLVLHSQEELIKDAVDLIQDALKDTCAVIPESLPFDDANSEVEAFTFLHILYMLLNNAEKSGDTVYLSLAGGRKNMSALMAILVPLFPCVNGLYHLIDKDEASRKYHFKSIEELFECSDDERHSFFFPPRDRMKLVDIPYGERQQVSESFRSKLYTVTEETFDDLYEANPEEAEALEFTQDIAQGVGQVLEVLLTEHAAKQFQELWDHDRTHARGLKSCLEHMRFTAILRNRSHDIYAYKLHKGEQDTYSQNLSSLIFHFFKRGGATERPVFYTLPKDVKNCSDQEVERVIVTELEFKRNSKYRELKEITASHHFPLGPFVPLSSILASVSTQEASSVLIVPLGTTPMIATQLYTLLSAQQKIHEVILVYPAGSLEVKNSVKVARDAFKEEGIECRPVAVQGYKDIDSRKACAAYLETLEKTIDDIRREAQQQHTPYKIELALSGGRKGMAALAMFAAQHKSIRYVYHTLIADKDTSRKVERETEIAALSGTRISEDDRNNRLFLREYEGNGPYTKFVLFKVPVLPARR